MFFCCASCWICGFLWHHHTNSLRIIMQCILFIFWWSRALVIYHVVVVVSVDMCGDDTTNVVMCFEYIILLLRLFDEVQIIYMWPCPQRGLTIGLGVYWTIFFGRKMLLFLFCKRWMTEIVLQLCLLYMCECVWHWKINIWNYANIII